MAEQLSDRLAKTLKNRNMTQRDLAKKSGATEASISHYLKGDRVPASDTLTKLAEALGVTPDYLLCNIEKKRMGLRILVRGSIRFGVIASVS